MRAKRAPSFHTARRCSVRNVSARLPSHATIVATATEITFAPIGLSSSTVNRRRLYTPTSTTNAVPPTRPKVTSWETSLGRRNGWRARRGRVPGATDRSRTDGWLGCTTEDSGFTVMHAVRGRRRPRFGRRRHRPGLCQVHETGPKSLDFPRKLTYSRGCGGQHRGPLNWAAARSSTGTTAIPRSPTMGATPGVLGRRDALIRGCARRPAQRETSGGKADLREFIA